MRGADRQQISTRSISYKRSTGILHQDMTMVALEPSGKRIKTPTVVAVSQPRQAL